MTTPVPPTSTPSSATYPDATTLRIERILPGPIERVFQYLTDEKLSAKWLGAIRLEPRVGGTIEITFDHANLTREPEPPRFKDCGGLATGRVTRFDPPRGLSFTWTQVSDTSEVAFDLSSQGENVLLVLVHRGLVRRPERVSVSGGWDTHLGVLEDVLKGGPVRPFWATFLAREAEYEKVIPAVV